MSSNASQSSIDYDVIVVGGGGAGLAAANAAGAAGSRVLVVEAADKVGGSTSLSHGIFYAAGTKVQRAIGVSGDTGEDMYRYAMALNQYRVEASVMRRYCNECGSALEWLMDLGVEFPPEFLAPVDVSGVPRSHVAAGGGAAITGALDAALAGNGVDVAPRSRVRELVIEDGVVRGVRFEGTTVRASSTVITTGGFGANRELLARHYPTAARRGETLWYIGSKHCQGDGLALGESVGAALAGHDRGLRLTTPGFLHTVELLPAWLFVVNAEGRRFMDVSVAYCVLDALVEAQSGQQAFGILDSNTFERPPVDPRFAQAFASGQMTSQWTKDILAEQRTAGRLIQAGTLGELAQQLGINASALEISVALHNASVGQRKDELFYTDPTFLHPVHAGPYYGVPLRNDTLCLTSTGLRIDADSRVIGNNNQPIGGLFAAGETTGGMMGERYIGSGNSVSHGVTYGRIAGRSAARNAARA